MDEDVKWKTGVIKMMFKILSLLLLLLFLLLIFDLTKKKGEQLNTKQRWLDLIWVFVSIATSKESPFCIGICLITTEDKCFQITYLVPRYPPINKTFLGGKGWWTMPTRWIWTPVWWAPSRYLDVLFLSYFLSHFLFVLWFSVLFLVLLLYSPVFCLFINVSDQLGGEQAGQEGLQHVQLLRRVQV